MRIIKSVRPAAGNQRKRKIEIPDVDRATLGGTWKSRDPLPEAGRHTTNRERKRRISWMLRLDGQSTEKGCDLRQRIRDSQTRIATTPTSAISVSPTAAARRRSSCRPNTHDASSAPVDHAPSVPVSPKVADPAPASRLILHSGRNRRPRSPHLAITNGCTAPNQR